MGDTLQAKYVPAGMLPDEYECLAKSTQGSAAGLRSQQLFQTAMLQPSHKS